MLPSRSRSREEPRLKAGEAGVDGPGKIGDAKIGLTIGGCNLFFSSSSVNCGSSFRLKDSYCALQMRSISDLYICCCSATLYRWADFGLLSASANSHHWFQVNFQGFAEQRT